MKPEKATFDGFGFIVFFGLFIRSCSRMYFDGFGFIVFFYLEAVLVCTRLVDFN